MKIIPLTPIDHIFTGVGSYPIEFVFAYQDTIDSARLQSSLVATLEQIPILRSKLVRISEHAYGFEPTDDGLSFETISSSQIFDESEDLYQYLNPVDTIEGEALTKIKLTQTPKGSVLGVSISHALADGFSYFHFLSSWARIFQGKPIFNPSHQRELLIPEILDHQKVLTPGDILNNCGAFWGDKRSILSRKQMFWERLLISKNTMNELLGEAKKECDVRLSYNDVITAYLWKKYINKWNDDKDNPITYVSCPFDFRRILKKFPKTYFGCAVCIATASINYESLISASIGKLALMIRKAVAQVNQDYIWCTLRTLASLRRQEGLTVMDGIHVMHPHNGLLVTNISRLPVQDFEFGAGTPTGFHILTPAQRGAVVLPARDSVDIRVCYPSGFSR